MLVRKIEGGHPPWGIKNPRQGGGPAGGRINQKVSRENIIIIPQEDLICKRVIWWRH